MMHCVNMKIVLPIQIHKSRVNDDDIMFVPKVWSSSKFVREKIIKDLRLCSLALWKP